MKEQIDVIKILDANASKVWQAINAIGGLDRWFPVIAACHVDGSGVGAMRTMELVGGGRIVDRIEAIDHDRQRFVYRRIEHPFPVTHYLGTVDVQDAGKGKTQLTWMVEVDVENDVRDDEVAEFIRSALSAGIDGLGRELMSE